MGIGATVIAALDKIFNYMPPIETKKPQALPAPQVATPQVEDTSNVRERIANLQPLSPPIPGPISPTGQLTPEQQNHVLNTTTQHPNTDVMTAQLEGIGKKAATVAIGATGSAIGAGSSASEAVAAGASAAVPAVVFSADAAMLGIAAVDIFGGDVAIPTYAPLSPEFDASTAAGRFHGTQEALVIKQSLAETGGAVKFRTSGRLTDDSIPAF